METLLHCTGTAKSGMITQQGGGGGETAPECRGGTAGDGWWATGS